MEELKLTKKWDKTFQLSKVVNHRKVVFHNRYGITLAADMNQKFMKVNCQQLQFVDPSVLLKNNVLACMQ